MVSHLLIIIRSSWYQFHVFLSMIVLLAPLRPQNILVLGIVEGAAIYHGNLVLHEKFQNFLVFISRNLNILLKFVVNYHPSVLRLSMSGSGHKRTELRPSNRGNIFLQPLVQQTFVALQFAIVCCPCYYLCAKQILMLQKVETASTFCNMNFFCARAGGLISATNNHNLQPNICCATSCKKILPVLLCL